MSVVLVLVALLAATFASLFALALAFPTAEVVRLVDRPVDRKVVEVREHHHVHVPWQKMVVDHGYLPVESLRGTADNMTAYVVGSGATVDAYPDDMWQRIASDDSCIVIGINQVHFAVPCDYAIQKDSAIRARTAEYCSASGCKMVVSQYQYGNYENDLSVREPERDGEAEIYMFSHPSNCNDEEINTAPIREHWPNYLVSSYSTVTSAVNLAGLMGASHCVLVGCDMGTVDGGRQNFRGYRQYQRMYKTQDVTPAAAYAEWVSSECMSTQLRHTIDVCQSAYDMGVSWAHPYASLADMAQSHADAVKSI